MVCPCPWCDGCRPPPKVLSYQGSWVAKPPVAPIFSQFPNFSDFQARLPPGSQLPQMKIINNQPTSRSPSKSSWLRSESRTPPDSLSSTYGTKIIFIFINTVINAIIIIIIIIVMIGITIIIIEGWDGMAFWIPGTGMGIRRSHSRFMGREREQRIPFPFYRDRNWNSRESAGTGTGII